MVFKHLPSRPASTLRAFTLIELLVVTGIIVIVTSIVLVNNNRFGGMVQLENLTYDVALSVRQAQVYGISVQRYGESDFSAGYGMHFDINDEQHYELFADADDNGRYIVSENIPPSPYTIRSGYKIHGLCVPQGADAASCMASYSASQVDIVFKRPEPDAFIRKDGEATQHESARIILISPRGDIMSVVVENNGQISVKRSGQ